MLRSTRTDHGTTNSGQEATTSTGSWNEGSDTKIKRYHIRHIDGNYDMPGTYLSACAHTSMRPSPRTGRPHAPPRQLTKLRTSYRFCITHQLSPFLFSAPNASPSLSMSIFREVWESVRGRSKLLSLEFVGGLDGVGLETEEILELGGVVTSGNGPSPTPNQKQKPAGIHGRLFSLSSTIPPPLHRTTSPPNRVLTYGLKSVLEIKAMHPQFLRILLYCCGVSREH